MRWCSDALMIVLATQELSELTSTLNRYMNRLDRAIAEMQHERETLNHYRYNRDHHRFEWRSRDSYGLSQRLPDILLELHRAKQQSLLWRALPRGFEDPARDAESRLHGRLAASENELTEKLRIAAAERNELRSLLHKAESELYRLEQAVCIHLRKHSMQLSELRGHVCVNKCRLKPRKLLANPMRNHSPFTYR